MDIRMVRTAPLVSNAVVQVPGSKSYSHRVLIAAALAPGTSTVENLLDSEDVRLTRAALEKLGIGIEGDDPVTVHGRGGHLAPWPEPIDLANSGTSVRLLTGIAALGKTPYVLTGSARMRQRPIQDLLDGLVQIGARAESQKADGCPPVTVDGGGCRGGALDLKCGQSSQYLSALLMMGPCTPKGLDIRVVEGPVSRPYIEMTIEVMRRFGITVSAESDTRFRIPGEQAYRPGAYRVEPDASQAGYFWAAAAITKTAVTVQGLTCDSRQGDLRLVDLLCAMGCTAERGGDGITVQGGPLRAIDVDMAHMPDMVPTLAVVAAFAEGTTRIRNVGHLRIKESDRLEAVARELKRMGVAAHTTDDGLVISGGEPVAAIIDTHDDHRLAMSFALAGLRVPGIGILNPSCVQKSFPGFWEVLESLYSRLEGAV